MSSTKVTVDWVLEKFQDVVDSDAPWHTKVKALELMGKYLNMFVDQKKVNIDVRQLITGASMDELRQLAGGKDEVLIDIKELGTGDSNDVSPSKPRVQRKKGGRPGGKGKRTLQPTAFSPGAVGRHRVD